ncbi:ATP-binding protein [Leucobacter sp. GX0328]
MTASGAPQTGGVDRRRVALAAAVWTLSWAFALAAVWIALAHELPARPLPGLVLARPPAEVLGLFPAIGLTVALVYGPVSALLLSRRVGAVGAILAVHALGSGLAVLGGQWGLLGEELPGLPLWGLLAHASGWGYIPGTFMTAVLPVLVTRARLPRWQRCLVAIGAANACVATAAALVHQSASNPRNPLAPGDGALQSSLPGIYLVSSFVAVGLALVTGGILATRWARARGAGRTGLAWLTLGHLFLSGSYAVLVLPAPLRLPGALAGVALLAPVLGQVIYPAGILVVVLGQGLWGQRVVVSRILLWTLLTISGAALYLAIVLAAPRFVPWPEGLEIAVPILIALAIQPLRGWIQSRIDRLVYGEGAEPAAMLARLGAGIGELEAGPAGLRELCEALRRVLRLASVEVRSGVSRTVAIAGDPGGAAVRIPLPGSAGELVATAPVGQRLDRRSISALRDLAGLVAAAVHLIDSNRHLDVAREDFFARRAGERRAVQQELHDGLGPALAGIGFGLAAVANLVETNPGRAVELLAELEQDVARRTRAVRQLAGEVSPSPLDGSSLPEALAELAARFRTERMAVAVEIRPEPLAAELSQGVQDAVYLIAAEALTNAARHSGAKAVRIVLETQPGALRLEVSDDGRGLPEAHAPGVGLLSLRRRAEAFGGSMSLTSGPEGTSVAVTLPLAGDGDSASSPEPGHPPVAGSAAQGHN